MTLSDLHMRKKSINIATVNDLVDNLNIISDLQELKSRKGEWESYCNTNDPIALEIGFGNGGFLQQLIAFNESQERSLNYIGMEKKPDRVFKAYNKNKESIEGGILKLLVADATNITEYFNKHEIQEIYLNFSDPWPKARHQKKRLTAPGFLTMYKNILNKTGDLYIKTDKQEFFEYSLETLPQNGFTIIEQSDDLHKEDFTIKNFVTEFESRWIKEGKNINYIHAKQM